MSKVQVKQQHHFVSLCRKMTAKGVSPGWATARGREKPRRDDVETAQQDGDVSPGPAGMELSALQELHLGAALTQRDWVYFSQTCTIFHSVPPKHCCCPAHFNVHGKLFSSRCSYLGLNNCLQLYEHHIKNTNKGTKTINFCSIMLWLTGAKKSKLALRPAHTAFTGTVPLDFVFLNHPQSSGLHWFLDCFGDLSCWLPPFEGEHEEEDLGTHKSEIFTTGQEPFVTCPQNDHCLLIFLFW